MTGTTRSPDLAPGAVVAASRARSDAIVRVGSYLLVGVVFGAILVKSEVVSWYRIQEMFRIHSFHMYGIIGSASATAAIGVQLLKRFGIRAWNGEAIVVPAKHLGRGYRYWIGGFIFGTGWALTGTCPGPLFALLGTGASALVVVLTAALLGTWVYGGLRGRLPH
jgi:uncharacterized membrane protein YedE/YeeE